MSRRSATDDYRAHAVTAYQQSYKQVNYGIINEWIRKHNIDDKGTELIALKKDKDSLVRRVATVVKSLDEMTQASRGHRPIKLYRGVSERHYRIGIDTGAIVNKSFTSSTKALEHARKFGKVVLCFTVPSDIGAYKFDNEYEEEMLIERNTQFVSFVEQGMHDNVLLVECKIAKYTPPTLNERKTMENMIKDQREKFLKSLKEMDEEIDWDDI